MSASEVTVSFQVTKKKAVANVLDLGVECSSGGSWVDKELALVLESLELVGVPREQDVDVHLTGSDVEGLGVAPGNDLVTMDDSNADRAMCDDL